MVVSLIVVCVLGWPTGGIQPGTPTLDDTVGALPVLTPPYARGVPQDWLVDPVRRRAQVFRNPAGTEVTLANGLLSRTFRVSPNGATVAYDNLCTGEPVIRAVKPEARLVIDGRSVVVGGLTGQREFAYLRPEWIEEFTSTPDAFRLEGIETKPIAARFPWKRVRPAEDRPWPPPGVSLRFTYRSSRADEAGLEVDVNYELYDGLPLLSKWLTIRNNTSHEIHVEKFTAEVLAVVEVESAVEVPDRWREFPLHVESDYAFHGMGYSSANETTHWVPDPDFATQVNYRRLAPVQLESRPRLGPDRILAPGEELQTFRTYELLFDSDDRERRGLALRRMYRTLAPWVTENPILMHVRQSDRESLRAAIDQCAEVGFEMVILTFGSGFDMENEDPAYLERLREDIDYAHAKGIEVGGYSLLASRSVSPEHDALHPETGQPGGAIYGNSPCLCSQWGQEYFAKLRRFIEATGLDLLEHDGNYPGDVCASTSHAGHRGLEDSQWNQWRAITDFYRWCRQRGVYLNVPDWYFLNGSNKVAMGYRETNWSLSRERQIVLGRQNIYDGTWNKTPSMGWMFVPLVEYHGGGAAATLEPLSEHLDAYEAHLIQNFGAGVQACYRGPRIYDTPKTREVVRQSVDFYLSHRAILDSDIVHVRRPDGRDLDAILHVNPRLATRGLAMVYNPTSREITRSLELPLHYAGLHEVARVQERSGPIREVRLGADGSADVSVTVPAGGFTFLTVTPPVDEDRLERGPFVGAVTPTSALVWARAREAGRFECTLRDGQGTTVARASATARPENDFCIRWELASLAPGRAYWFEITQGDQVVARGPESGFQTPVAPDAPARTTIAFASCVDEKQFPDQPIWDRIAANTPAALVLLGDTPYIDSTKLTVQRRRYRDFYGQPGLARLLARTPFYATWDDHDFGRDDTDGRLAGKEHSRRAFMEYHANPSYGDGDAGIYTRFRSGPVEVYLLDTRWFAGTEPSPVDGARTTLLGKAQWDWLEASLRQSTAPFKILASGMIWNGATRPQKPDHWMSYPHERQALFELIGTARVTGVVLVGGDIHRSRALRYPTRESAGYDLTELITSPAANTVIEAANAPSPHLLHDVGETETCLLITADTSVEPSTLVARCLAADGRELFRVELTEEDLRAGH